MTVRIVVDSTSDLSPEDQGKYHIEVVPLTVHFGEEAFLDDGFELTKPQFFERLQQAEQLPTTSQVNPQQFYEHFRPHLEAGDEVVGIFVSSTFSGTYNSACTARDMLAADGLPTEKIYLIDTMTATMSHALLAWEAAKLRDQGYTAADIFTAISALAPRVTFLAIVDTVKYLRLGGRISATSAFAGGLLGIKPLITVIEGKVLPLSNARSLNAALKKLHQEVKRNPPDLNYGFVLAHANAPDLIERTATQLKDLLGGSDWLTCSLGSVLGTYSGPNCVGLAYITA